MNYARVDMVCERFGGGVLGELHRIVLLSEQLDDFEKPYGNSFTLVRWRRGRPDAKIGGPAHCKRKRSRRPDVVKVKVAVIER